MMPRVVQYLPSRNVYDNLFSRPFDNKNIGAYDRISFPIYTLFYKNSQRNHVARVTKTCYN